MREKLVTTRLFLQSTESVDKEKQNQREELQQRLQSENGQHEREYIEERLQKYLGLSIV